MVYALAPRGYRNAVKDWIRLSGSSKSPKSFINNAFAFSFAVGFVAGLFAMDNFLIIWGAGSVGMFLLFNGFLVLGMDRRAKFVENILPDALQLMAANSRAGYIPSRALMLSARKEFGPLAHAVRNAGKEMATGKPLDEALKDIAKNINSATLRRTVRLIIEGSRAGGQFASLLEETAADIRMKQAIRKEAKANIIMYTIFVGFAGCVGAPVMYALSFYLIQTIGQFGQAIDMQQIPTNMPFMKFTGVSISGDFLLTFSVIAILITTVFSSLIIGLIATGKERSGIRYMPVVVLLALAIFFIVKIVAAGLMGQMMPV